MFTKAKLKLTAWYLIIILTISGTLSALLYFQVSTVLENQYERIMVNLQMQDEKFQRKWMGPINARISPEHLRQAKQDLLHTLFKLNGLIVILFVVFGYVLSDKTLEPIKQALDEQKRFVSDAAHELRTPITGLRTSLEVNLMDQTLNEKAKKILQENLDDVISLEQLTENLLKLANYDENEIELKPVDIIAITKRAVKHVQPLAKKKKIRLKAIYSKKYLYILADESAFLDLVMIFLDNAVKYTPKKGRITLKIEQKKKNAEVIIKDTGKGISKNNLPKIFDRFYRVDIARSGRNEKGYGLGLSVAKKVIHKFRGKVDVVSKLQKGTEFVLTFPLCTNDRSQKN